MTKKSILRQSSVSSGAFDVMKEAGLGFGKLLEPVEKVCLGHSGWPIQPCLDDGFFPSFFPSFIIG